MSNMLASFMEEIQTTVNEALLHYMSKLMAPELLTEAMQYSLMAGGKRIRPVFLLATIDAFGKDSKKGIRSACAIEMIHTYSLIHDDLPAMDNDDYRRGKLTNHKVYGEAMAILAGDALLTHAFRLLATEATEAIVPSEEQLTAQVKLRLVEELSLHAGAKGMVGGQVMDMLGETEELTLDQLYYIHEHKTADLLMCSVRMGCILAGASEKQLDNLSAYAKHIGLAFQIQDDILDEIGDEAKLGKKVGSDRQNQKTTFVSLLGVEGAKEKLLYHIQASKDSLAKANVKQNVLLALAEYMVQREY